MRKFNFVDLFAGAGGFGLGLQLTRHFQMSAAIEVDAWAAETLRANNKSRSAILQGDIRDFVHAPTIKEAVGAGIDVVVGGPPCQGFSNAVKHTMKDPNDPRNTLFLNYTQWIDILQPKVFVMENVKGILSRKDGHNRSVIATILNSFHDIGYHCDVWSLNAADFGIPQNRERIFIVGNRFNREILPPDTTHTPKPTSTDRANGLLRHISVWQALSDLPQLSAGEGEEEQKYTRKPKSDFQEWARSGSDVCFNHVSMKHRPRVVRRFEHILAGNSKYDLPDELRILKRNGNGEASDSAFDMNYRPLVKNMPSYTIPASFYSSFIHPTSPRNITAREAARIQSFPDDYVFKGKRTVVSAKLLNAENRPEERYLSQYNQIGNAVPPLLGAAVASKLYEFLHGKVM